MSKQLEYVGVKLPGQGRRIAQIAIGPYEKEEQIFQRISKVLGAEFRLCGISYKVVSSDPFKIERVGAEEAVPFKRREAEGVEEDIPLEDHVEASDYLHVEVVESTGEVPKAVEPKTPPKKVSTPKPTPQRNVPAVGERWVAKDTRRSNTSFVIVNIVDDVAYTDTGRTVKLDRFRRYERV